MLQSSLLLSVMQWVQRCWWISAKSHFAGKAKTEVHTTWIIKIWRQKLIRLHLVSVNKADVSRVFFFCISFFFHQQYATNCTLWITCTTLYDHLAPSSLLMNVWMLHVSVYSTMVHNFSDRWQMDMKFGKMWPDWNQLFAITHNEIDTMIDTNSQTILDHQHRIIDIDM